MAKKFQILRDELKNKKISEEQAENYLQAGGPALSLEETIERYPAAEKMVELIKRIEFLYIKAKKDSFGTEFWTSLPAEEVDDMMHVLALQGSLVKVFEHEEDLMEGIPEYYFEISDKWKADITYKIPTLDLDQFDSKHFKYKLNALRLLANLISDKAAEWKDNSSIETALEFIERRAMDIEDRCDAIQEGETLE